MITLCRGKKGQLTYDSSIHEKRLELAGCKERRTEAFIIQAKAAILLACRWYAEHQWPLSKSNLTRDKNQFLPDAVNHLGYKQTISPIIDKLISEGWLKQIKIKGTNGHVLDVANGLYASGVNAERANTAPSLPWDQYEYLLEHQEYRKK